MVTSQIIYWLLTFQATLCCGVSGGGAGAPNVANVGKSALLGYDCLMIPGAKTIITKNGAIAMNAKGETQCGGNNGIGTDAAGTVSATICCEFCILN